MQTQLTTLTVSGRQMRSANDNKSVSIFLLHPLTASHHVHRTLYAPFLILNYYCFLPLSLLFFSSLFFLGYFTSVSSSIGSSSSLEASLAGLLAGGSGLCV